MRRFFKLAQDSPLHALFYFLASTGCRRNEALGVRWQDVDLKGWVFKDAGWRKASIVAVWAIGEKEPLVVITDLRPSWEIVNWYGRRFWIETGFRNDKKKGWQ